MKHTFETERLILRPWQASDAQALYELAKDPRVGPIAGWPPHQNVQESTVIIQDVLSDEGTYAICLKDPQAVIGSIGLMEPRHDFMGESSLEIGYWIGVPYWGKGYTPEAAAVLIEEAFEILGKEAVWSGYFDQNVQSKRVQEKCGLRYHHSEEVEVPLLGEVKLEHFTCLRKEDWQKGDASY